MGHGSNVGQEKILSYFHPIAEYITYIWLTSGDGNSAAWAIQENTGILVTSVSQNLTRYNLY